MPLQVTFPQKVTKAKAKYFLELVAGQLELKVDGFKKDKKLNRLQKKLAIQNVYSLLQHTERQLKERCPDFDDKLAENFQKIDDDWAGYCAKAAGISKKELKKEETLEKYVAASFLLIGISLGFLINNIVMTGQVVSTAQPIYQNTSIIIPLMLFILGILLLRHKK